MSAVLYVGDARPGTTSEMRLRALVSLGFSVMPLGDNIPESLGELESFFLKASYKLGVPLDRTGVNCAVVRAVERFAEPAILWIDKGVGIRPETLRRAKHANRALRVVGFSPDDMVARHNRSRFFTKCLPLYDAFITTKSYGVPELTSLGCPRVVFVDNAYDPATHRPMPQDCATTRQFGCDVGFVGHFEAERARMIEHVAATGTAVSVRGNGWDRWQRSAPRNISFGAAVMRDDYARAISATRINLGFLRKINRDLQTTRSIEIPACGGFMLAERSAEHLRLFAEGEEAEFFDTPAELVQKIQRYLADESARVKIAAAGRERCLRDDYSYAGRLGDALNALGIPVPTACGPDS